MIADTEELEKLDGSQIYPRRVNAKEVLNHEKEKNSLSQYQMVQQKLSGRDCEFREPTLRREQIARREDLSENL